MFPASVKCIAYMNKIILYTSYQIIKHCISFIVDLMFAERCVGILLPRVSVPKLVCLCTSYWNKVLEMGEIVTPSLQQLLWTFSSKNPYLSSALGIWYLLKIKEQQQQFGVNVMCLFILLRIIDIARVNVAQKRLIQQWNISRLPDNFCVAED